LAAKESHYRRTEYRRLHLPANLTTASLASMWESVERSLQIKISHFSGNFRKYSILISLHKLPINVVYFSIKQWNKKATVGTQGKADLMIQYEVHILRGKQMYLVTKEEDKDKHFTEYNVIHISCNLSLQSTSVITS
jgi:hypothetical protein